MRPTHLVTSSFAPADGSSPLTPVGADAVVEPITASLSMAEVATADQAAPAAATPTAYGDVAAVFGTNAPVNREVSVSLPDDSMAETAPVEEVAPGPVDEVAPAPLDEAEGDVESPSAPVDEHQVAEPDGQIAMMPPAGRRADASPRSSRVSTCSTV